MTEVIQEMQADNITMRSMLELLIRDHPDVADLVDGPRAAKRIEAGDNITSANEFESDKDGGRGDSYRRAQRDVTVRATGFERLLTMAVAGRPITSGGITGVPLVLDVLGGDGTMARAARLLTEIPPCRIITSDLAGTMVARALESGLPAIRQPAQELILRDESIDAVIVAYGTHHLQPAQYSSAVREAARVLRPGGRLVTHDFEPGSDMARFFHHVVDRHARLGHPYPHVSGAFMREEMLAAGFVNVRVARIEDPYQATGPSPAGAKNALLSYLRDMYGLRDVYRPAAPMSLSRLERDCNQYFSSGITVERLAPARYVARLGRTAVVAVGERSAGGAGVRSAG